MPEQIGALTIAGIGNYNFAHFLPVCQIGRYLGKIIVQECANLLHRKSDEKSVTSMRVPEREPSYLATAIT